MLIMADLKASEVKTEDKAIDVSKAKLPEQMPTEKSVAMVTVVMEEQFNPLFHPYQRRWIPALYDLPEGIEMPIDSWLQSQIDAKLVKVIK